ncbi:hypothetical protein JZO73_10005 [Enterococcus plantarum]|uniref:hypothetical protein n=1 Tax=Enterococcus plantarum TaxID=1077675 RepID=UPI001A8F9EF5|nr:hypothetical protein [Enterococcus plantarum]MBO0467863.1 hypothetical protein [Enterococcus plantarum]
MAIEKISIDMKSNSEEIAKQLSKIDSKIKQLKIEKTKVQSSVKKLEKSLSEFKGFSFIEDAAKSIESGATALKEVNDKVPSDLSKIGPKLTNMGIAIVGMGTLAAIAEKLASGDAKVAKTGFKTIRDIGKLLAEAAETMSQIAVKVPSDLDSMGARLGNMGIAIAGMGALVAIAGKLASSDAKVAKTGFKTIRDIGKLLEEAAETMSQIATKVPSDLGSMGARLGNMGIAIVGIGVLVGIAGKLAQDNPKEAKKGFQMIREIGKLLEEAAETMSQIAAKVPSDLGEMGSRLGSMGIAIGGMGVLITIAGKLAQDNPKEAKKGFQMIREIGKLLEEAAETMSQIAAKVPSDLGEMGSRLGSMGIAIGGMGVLIAIAGKLAQDNPKEAKKGFQMIREIGKLLEEAAETMSQIAAKVPSDLGEMGSRLGSMGIAIGGMGVLVAIAGKLAKDHPKEAKAGFKMIRDLSSLLGETAEAMGQIAEKVPGDFGSIGGKLLAMGAAIGGMGLLVGIVGLFAEKKPEMAMAGLESIGGIITLLTEAAEAMKQIDEKVPDDIANVAAKLANIGIAIGGMSVLVGVVGALVSSGVGALIAGAGLATVFLVAEELMHVSEALNQLDQKVPDDTSSVKGKIDSVATAIGYFTAANLGNVVDLFKNAVGALNTAVVAEGVIKLAKVGTELQKFEDITVPANIETKINEIQSVFEYLKKGVGFLKEFDQFFNGGKTDTDIGKDAAEAVGNLVSVAKAIEQLEETEITDPAGLKTKIESIQKTFEYFTKTKGWFDDVKRAFDGGDIDTKITEKAKTYVSNLANIANELYKIQEVDLNFGDIKTKLDDIQDIIKDFEQIDLDMELDSTALNDTVEKAGLINQLITHLEKALTFTFDAAALDNFKATMANISLAIQEILTADLIPKDDNGKASKIPSWEKMEADVQQAIDKLEKLNSLGEQLKTALGYGFDTGKLETFKDTMNNMSTALREVLTKDLLVDENGEELKFTAWEKMQKTVTDAVAKITELNNLGEQLETALGFTFNEEKIEEFQKTLGHLKSAVQILSGFNFEFIGPLKKGDSSSNSKSNDKNFTETARTTKAKIEQITKLMTEIDKITNSSIDPELLNQKLLALTKCLNQIRQFIIDTKDIGNVEAIQNSITAFSNMVEQLATLKGDFEVVGTSYANSLLNKFNEINPTGAIMEKVNTLISDLKLKYGEFTEIGRTYGENLKTGFAEGVANMLSSLTDVINKLTTDESKAQFTAPLNTLGNTLGASLIDGFKEGIRGMATAINEELKNVKTATTKSQGGEVEFHASGGLAGIFKKKGTDTVPAMLTPGEFVQRRAAVSTFGLDFMNKVNNLDVRGAFSALTGRFNTQSMLIPAVSTVVNNINHTTNNANRVTQNVVGGNADYIMKRASRYLR